MKKINLIGPVDKRLIAYPLLKAIDLLGKCLVITDDANFRRFADDYSLNFNYGNSDFIIVHQIDQFSEKDLEQPMSVYDFVVYITTNTLIESDLVVYCHGVEKSFATDEVKDKLQDIEHSEVYITPSNLKMKGIIHIPVGKNMSYVWGCEEHKEFLPCKDSNLVKVVSHLFSDIAGVSKDEIVKIMGRKEG